MTEAILAACIQLSGKYSCKSSAGNTSGTSIVKVYTSVEGDAYNYRFGVVGKWDFLADGVSHPMADWPSGSAYRATCSERSLEIQQLREKAGKSSACGGFADRIIYYTQFLATSSGGNSFAFIKAESHHCAGGKVVDIPAVTVVCAK